MAYVSLTHELLIDSSRVGFASAVFKDRQEGRGGGLPPRSLKTQQHATGPVPKNGSLEMAGQVRSTF
jgi:hypothetical protein